MLDGIQVMVLSLVQGLTEFLPISSSAHLILVPELLGWKDQGLAFDTALHLGTLLAVISYFDQELIRMTLDFVKSLKGQSVSVAAKIFWSVGFATIPVGLLGFFCKPLIEDYCRSPKVIAVATLLFGLILWGADKLGKQNRSLETLHWKDVVVIGCGQALSLIPGTSRSGITLTAGLLNGLTREAAARFSFLLSIPVIILAGGVEFFSLLRSDVSVDWGSLSLGIGLSATSGYCCIHYFLKLLNKVGLFPFVLYRILLGIYLIFHFY